MCRRLRRSCLVLLAATAAVYCASTADTAALKEVQRAKSGAMEVVLLSEAGVLNSGKGQAVLEFRTGDDRHLVDVGTVTVNASMIMAGMGPMLGGMTLAKGDARGRYTLTTDLSMAGTWRMEVSWDGPAGTGMVNLAPTVR